MAQSHCCSFTAFWKALARRVRCHFLETRPRSSGGTRLSFLPARTEALSPDPAQQQLPQGLPASTFFSLNTNLLQQGFGSTPSLPAKIKAIQRNTSFFEDRNIQHHYHFPKAIVLNDKVNLWVPFVGVYSDEKHQNTCSPLAVLMEVTHIR